jgi:hypothetical protein
MQGIGEHRVDCGTVPAPTRNLRATLSHFLRDKSLTLSHFLRDNH